MCGLVLPQRNSPAKHRPRTPSRVLVVGFVIVYEIGWRRGVGIIGVVGVEVVGAGLIIVLAGVIVMGS